MHGLAPGAPAPLPPARHFFGMVDSRDSFPFEALSIAPAGLSGPRVEPLRLLQALAEGIALLTIRSQARAVCWQPAGSWMDAGYFFRMIESWRAGGAFPALGLTPLETCEDGGLISDGLTFFIGRELRVDPRRGEHPGDTVRIAVRAIDHLVRSKQPAKAQSFRGPRDEVFDIQPEPDGRTMCIKRGR